MEAHVFNNFFLRWDFTFQVTRAIKLTISVRDWHFLVARFSKNQVIYISKLEALFSGRLLVYQGAPTVHFCWLISFFIHSSTISWSKQWNRTLQKPSSSATPFGTSTIYSVLTMWTSEIISALFTRRNWNLRTLPHHLLKCVASTRISRLAT